MEKDELDDITLTIGTPGHICFEEPIILIDKNKYIKFLKKYREMRYELYHLKDELNKYKRYQNEKIN